MKPILHFTPNSGWIGDPNGLVYKDGLYHMFFQYEPYELFWTPIMYWGHATSKDLINWTQHKIALSPDELGTMWSGSAVVDKGNTAGFGKNSIVCMYTSAGGFTPDTKDKKFTQSLAYSTDDYHFTKYNGNPVIDELVDKNRDPKVIWHEETQKWIMVLFMNDGDIKDFGLFESNDLKSWNLLQRIELDNARECPDFFSLECDGVKKWVFMSTRGQYVVGSFDGHQFTKETKTQRCFYGKAYSSQVWYDPSSHPRVILLFRLGSMLKNSNDISQMTFPVELRLKRRNDSYILECQPVNELFNMLKEIPTQETITLDNLPVLLSFKVKEFTDTPVITTSFGPIIITQDSISYDGYKVKIDTTKTISMLIDLFSVEIYCDGSVIAYSHPTPINSVQIDNSSLCDLRMFR